MNPKYFFLCIYFCRKIHFVKIKIEEINIIHQNLKQVEKLRISITLIDDSPTFIIIIIVLYWLQFMYKR